MGKRKKPAITLPGTVEKIIPAPFSSEPEKAEISVEGADPLYKEIRIENKLQDEEGNEVGLKPGAEVDVTIEAEPGATKPKKPARLQSDNKDEVEEEANAGNGQKQ
jgi:hypothetical protein